MKYRLIASDIDGTLCNSKKIVSQRTIDSIIKAQKQGIVFTPVSGRHIGGLKPILKQVPSCDYLIGCNGALIYDVKQEKLIYEDYLPLDEALKVSEIAHKYNALFDAYVYDLCLTSTYNMAHFMEVIPDETHRRLFKTTRTVVESVEDYLIETNKRINKLLILPTHEETKANLLKELQEQLPNLTFTSSNSYNIEINSKTTSKGKAIQLLAKTLNIPISQTIGFGDNANDFSLLKAVNTAVVMENGVDDVKKIAHIITDTNDNDGVAKIIESII